MSQHFLTSWSAHFPQGYHTWEQLAARPIAGHRVLGGIIAAFSIFKHVRLSLDFFVLAWAFGSLFFDLCFPSLPLG